MEPTSLVPPEAEAAAAAVTERFQPGGVLHALVSGLLEAALAAVLLACSLLVGGSSDAVATSLTAAAVLWGVLSVVSLVTALLRARVHAAELDDEAVALHGVTGARRYRYDELSAVEVSRGRTRLVSRNGRAHMVRGVRGPAQGNRFRARVLARATEAVERRRAGREGGTSGAGEDPQAGKPPSGTGDAGRLPDTDH